jgi:ABC-2 type transport system permease protein
MSTDLLIEPTTRLQQIAFATGDALTSVRRYVWRARRQPDVIVGSVLMPIVFVVLFGYVFGSSISVQGGDYRSYLMSGLFAQSTLFASSAIAVAVATDMSEGVIDRFKTMPVARSSVLVGRTVAGVIVGLPSLVVMIVCGLAVGWHPQDGLANAILGFALLQLFGFAMGWVGVVIGLYAKSPQAADAIAMLPAFLLGFISNVFVDPTRMPAWLQTLAQWNPMSAVVAATRKLFGTTGGAPVHDVWSLQHPIVTTLAMSAGTLLVCVTLGVRRYNRVNR